LLGNWHCHGNQHLLGDFLMLAPKYEVDMTSMNCGTLCARVTLTFWPWNLVTWCDLCGQSLCQGLTFLELVWWQCYIDLQLKVPIFTHHLSDHTRPERRITTYCALGCNLWLRWRDQKRQNPSSIKLKLTICTDHPRQRRPLKFCVWCNVHKVVIYFKFHENWLRGLKSCGGRKMPFFIDLGHGLYNSLYKLW